MKARTYRQKTLLKRKSIRLKDRRTAAQQTQAFQHGHTVRFYGKELAKKVAGVSQEANGKMG